MTTYKATMAAEDTKNENSSIAALFETIRMAKAVDKQEALTHTRVDRNRTAASFATTEPIVCASK